jgi:hypothetical protein
MWVVELHDVRRDNPGAEDRPAIRLATTEQVWSWSTQCLNTSGLPCCWGLSQGCGSVRCAECGSLTSISRAVSCTPRCSSVAEDGTDFLATDGCGAQGKNWDVERAFADAVEKVDGLPDGFRFHDLRRYFASVLIAGECE